MNKKVSLADCEPFITGQLEEGGSISFTVRGTSMSPMLSDGIDTVKIVKADYTPKKYDVIFYRRNNGQFVLHRIIKKKKEGYGCRGDNQIALEYPVTQDMIIGVLKEYTHKGKTISTDSFSRKLYAFLYVNTAFVRYYAKYLYQKIKGNNK